MSVQVTMPVPPCAVEVERFPELGFGSCPIGTTEQELALSPDRRLRNCTLHRTALGGVSDILEPGVDVAALLDAPERARYRAELPEFCAGCQHEQTCGGRCRAAAAWVFGTSRAVDPFVMQHVDDAFAERLERERTP